MKKILFYGICAIAIMGCFKLLELQDQQVKKRAITRCGGASNIVEHYTREGDLYFSCRVE